MKKIAIAAGSVAAISGAALAGSSRLLPPVLTTVFAISATVTIWTLLKMERRRA